jgi:hypothetical protein
MTTTEITVYRRSRTEDAAGGVFWTDSIKHAESLPEEVFGAHIITAVLDVDCDLVTVENGDAVSHDVDELREEYPGVDVIAGPCDAGVYGNTTYIVLNAWQLEA